MFRKGLMLFVCLLFGSLSISAQATIELKNDVIVVHQQGNYEANDLFDAFKNLFPGDHKSMDIQILNSSDLKNITVSFQTNIPSVSDQALLDVVHLYVSNQNQVLFDGKLGQLGQADSLNGYIPLGKLNHGQQATLHVEIALDAFANNTVQKQFAQLDWKFRFDGTEVPKVPTLIPNTGDSSRTHLYSLVLVGVILVLFLIFVIKRKIQDKTQQELS